MKAKPQAGGNWKPTAEQELLLRAALWEGEEARTAWRAWSAQVDWDALDGGSERLLPLVYTNLLAIQEASPGMERLREAYHGTWADYHVLVKRAEHVLALLQAAEIPTMLLKGCALIPRYYPDPATRPTSDLDIAVPTAMAVQALDQLAQHGWRPIHSPLQQRQKGYMSRVHAYVLRDAKGSTLDLHRHILSIETRSDGDRDFWADAVEVGFDGVRTCVMNPADQLVHVCAHGAEWNPVPPLRWVADAWMIVRKGQVDWARLVEQAQKRELVLTLRHTLGYLAERMIAVNLHALDLRVEIPSSVLRKLRELPVTRLDQAQYELWIHPRTAGNTALKLWYHYNQFRGLDDVYQNENRFLRFPAFLRDTWELSSTRQVPAYMLRYATKRIARRMKSFTLAQG